MPAFASYVTLVLAIIFLFSPLPAAANLPETQSPTVAAIKVFQLEHKDVVAVAVETRLPAASVPDPLTYTFEPQYRITEKNSIITLAVAAQSALPANTDSIAVLHASPRLTQLTTTPVSTNELTLTAVYTPKNAKVTVTTVKRKRVIQPDNTIIFRTYLVLTFSNPRTTTPPPKTLVLDPGHGGTALGATSNYLLEKELNLDIALLSRDLFRQHGYDVYMTRTDDSNPSLLDRADAANILQADVFLSIHNNSMATDMPDAAKKLYRGTTALYNSSAPKPAKELATLLANELTDILHIHQYPLQDRPGLVVLNSSWVPAVIAEVAMMPHPQDAKLLSQRVYRHQAALAIFQATDKYLSFTTLPAKTVFASPITNGLANSANNGLAVVDNDGTLYYLDLTGDTYAGGQENIYRLKPGETKPTAISSDEAWNLTISGKYLYYSNWSDQHHIYRMQLDGSEKTKINNQPACQLTATSNWLVYTTWTNDNSVPGPALYKLALDGQSEPQKLCDDQAETITIAGDWVYFLNASDGYRMYKIKLDGTSRSKIADDQVLFMAVADNTIYYSNYSDSQKLYSISTDGQRRTKLTDDQVSFINIANGFVYFTNASANHALYRLNIKTHNKQLICDLGMGPQPINLINNSVYYNRLFFTP